MNRTKLTFGGDCDVFPQIKKSGDVIVYNNHFILDQPVRLPFANKISERYVIRSCAPDTACGNGIHHFHVEATNDAGEVDYTSVISFQHGALHEPDSVHNGLLSTVLIQILITHLSSFQSGSYADEGVDYTGKAVEKLMEALFYLSARADERSARGVLGKHAK
jgi:hypothetical protein